jgi:hypothetical protein
VETETPASLATSCIVTVRFLWVMNEKRGWMQFR